jgi:type I restriction enzyme M protein
MPAKKKAKETAAQVKTLEAQLWDAADKMRGAVPPTDYMHVCLGMVFLRYLSAAFERKENELMNTLYAVKDDPEEYQADNVFWVPLEARWGTLRSYARSADIGKRLDDAMRAIERYNDELKGVLPKIFGKADFSAQMLGGLIDHFTNLNLSGTPDDFDLLGRVYEFFLGEFSAMQGKAGGEQYTPRCMVSLMVEMIEPFRGRIYDPCCGTGGFYVQSNRFVLAHAGRLDDVAVFGQERNPETYRLARMNLAIRGITGDIRWNSDGTLLKDAFPDMRFDSVLANPPFNIKEWGGEFLRDDARWKFGVPPLGNANFAWLQHMYHHLTPNGYAAVILANGSMSSNSGGEGEIRKAMVEGDAVDCMVALPNQLFFGTQIPVCVWIMAKDKSGGKHGERQLRDRRGEVLFLDARKLGYMVNRTQKNLSPEDIAKLSDTYHAWREGKDYENVSGFCKSASLEEIRAHGHVLTPGRYVGAEDVEEDDEAFEEKMPRLAAALRERFAKRATLEKQVNANLEGMGYGI